MKKSSKQKLLDFLLANTGKVLDSYELQRAAGGAVEFARRLRELRAEGWDIATHKDDAKLKKHEYILRSGKQGKGVAFSRGISKETRARVLERNGYTCQMCGVAAGDTHPHNNRRANLHMGHIVDKSKGGSDNMANLRALCSVCNEGAQNITPIPPKSVELLAAVRRADRNAQKAVYQWLREKFKDADK
ncbi:MAG: HNH endonuclease [Gammaproteobacteria bacterium]